MAKLGPGSHVIRVVPIGVMGSDSDIDDLAMEQPGVFTLDTKNQRVGPRGVVPVA